MMMVRDHHTVAQSTLAQRGLYIGHALLAIFRIIFIGSNCRRRLTATRLILSDSEKWSLRLAVYHGRHGAPSLVVGQFKAIFYTYTHNHEITPIALARSTN